MANQGGGGTPIKPAKVTESQRPYVILEEFEDGNLRPVLADETKWPVATSRREAVAMLLKEGYCQHGKRYRVIPESAYSLETPREEKRTVW